MDLCLHSIVPLYGLQRNAFKLYRLRLRSRYCGSLPDNEKSILFCKVSISALGPFQLLFSEVPGVKRSGREIQKSLQSSDGFKNAWNYTSTTPYFYSVIFN